jgi:hypothetical protein
MQQVDNFKTESGERYQWTPQQVESYRQARSAGVDERQAIDAAQGASQARNPKESVEGIASAPDIYARRERTYAVASGIAAPRAVAPACNALPEPGDVYAARADTYREAGLRGIR